MSQSQASVGMAHPTYAMEEIERVRSQLPSAERIKFCLPEAIDKTTFGELDNDCLVKKHFGSVGNPEKLMDEWRRQDYGLWCLLEKSSDSFLGLCGLQLAKDWDEKVELICAITEGHRRRGFAYEACNAVLMWSDKHLKGNCVFCRVAHSNCASIKLINRLHMQEIERRKDLYDGEQIVYKWSGLCGHI